MELAANIKKKNVSVGIRNFPKHLNFVSFPPKCEKKPDIFILKHSYVKNNGKESKKLCTLLAKRYKLGVFSFLKIEI